jgi:hypothetical protein
VTLAYIWFGRDSVYTEAHFLQWARVVREGDLSS